MDFKNNKPLLKRMIIMAVALIIFFGAIFGFGLVRSIMMQRFIANFKIPPVSVTTAKVQSLVWEPMLSATGSLVAINGVQVTSEVSGLVEKILFDSGSLVRKGDLLIQLDDAEDLQDLKNFQAKLNLADINYERQRKLYKTGSTAASALDEALATLQQSQAAVGKTEVLIEKKAIRAPFDGKIGIRQVNLGQFVNPGSALVSLQALNPLYVHFYLPEQDLKSLYLNQRVLIKVEGQPEKTFEGKITALNSEVNAQTRNLLVQATIPNPQLLLYPGMFAEVSVVLPQKSQVLTVPQTAVAYNLFGDSIFVVKKDGKDRKGNPATTVNLVYVTVGERRGNQVAILKGVKAGDEVVTSGQLKLQDGSSIAINNIDNDKKS